MTGTFQFTVPSDLLTEAQRQTKQPGKDQLKVEGWKTTWLSRLSELVIGKD
jgi:hypothetical protein